jgi:hypothetical protein
LGADQHSYVDTCTRAIDTLYLLVLHTSFDFERSKEIAQENADEFIEALTIGLRSQKKERAEKRERLMQGRE